MVEFSETQLTAESDVASDSESCDVTIKAENDRLLTAFPQVTSSWAVRSRT